MLDCIEIQPPRTADACVMWLHGLGADGNDFVPVVDQLGLGADHGIRFVFPNAPVRPVTLNNGLSMPAWYDIVGTTADQRQDAAGIAASTAEIEALIARENGRGIDAARVVLAGFSQGGAVALHAGLRHGQTLAGIMGLSCYLPLHDSVAAEAAATNRATPIFLAHGSADPMLPVALGRASRDHLHAAGYAVAWHEYPMAHEVCMPEIAAIGAWLNARLAH